MSMSLTQLTAMVDTAEALAIEMRELIALRQIVASQSAERSRTIASKTCPRLNLKSHSKPTNHVLRTKVGAARSPVSA
jgi:hypothetical protein